MANELQIAIEGMHCEGCVRRVVAALQGVPGVEVEAVKVGAADVRMADGVAADNVLSAIDRIGFQASRRR